MAGVLPMDDNAARQKVDATALDAAVQVLDAAGGNVTAVGLAETRRPDRGGGAPRWKTFSAIRRRPTKIAGLDYMVTDGDRTRNYAGPMPGADRREAVRPTPMPRTLVIATRNRKKLEEMAAILAGLPADSKSLDAFGESSPWRRSARRSRPTPA